MCMLVACRRAGRKVIMAGNKKVDVIKTSSLFISKHMTACHFLLGFLTS